MPLFADVEAFPSFVPGYKSAEVVERKDNQYKTKGLCRKFRSDQHFVGNGFGYKADGE